jgi:hypothetical protein
MCEKNAELMFKPINQGGLGVEKMKQLFGNDVINPNVFRNKLKDKEFIKEILNFIKVE